ncbi:carboxyl-terminal PDZ ligand of neuronal nitric oxide synthase protein-like isoform X2 [Phymastichus coffea]|uniref:carboxyl-terminal PDZ ligand of neuronal nitric oxide synthase protein-like isoform X2 n=1 Tax=Phymastichus coffea TaxID=108790 RepID=UPI00273B51C8|nr:carboxyl-terminal PDZ ligand of neuronal nitric oxide synthase protein-like isoform X2 [Phymastichus coffea]
MEVPRPTSRMEIVAAMRRIRYEFKAKGIKKKKVTLEVSVDGLKVTLRKKKFPILQKKQHWHDESKLVLMHHPIYRIFYVSHDSHDLKIFSYIARDGNNNSFRCNVFKSSKKSQAMRVVRTVGQAFEVCHKLSLNNPPVSSEEQQQRDKDRVAGDGENHRRDNHEDSYNDRDDFASLQHQPSPASVHKDISLLGDAEDSILDQPCLLTTATTTTCPASPVRHSPLGNALPDQQAMELTALKHEIQLLRERLDQQSQQTRAAVAHARLLQDQLAAETAARVEAQARTHQLLVQNKELLEHIAALVSHLREQERISGVPSQVTSALTQGTADSLVGQFSFARNQYNSPWEPQLPAAPHIYSPLDSYYSGLGYNQRSPNTPSNGYTDELLQRYQAQLWDNLRAAAPTTPLYGAAPHCFPAGPGSNLPPTGRPRSQMSSPASTLQRPSRLPRPSSYRPPVFRSRSLERPVADRGILNNGFGSPEPPSQILEASFIKPLPCKCNHEPETRNRIAMKNNLHDLMRPLVIDSRSPERKRNDKTSIAVQTESNGIGTNCPLTLWTESKTRMEDESDSGEEERNDLVAELPMTRIHMRRNSQ